MNITLLNTKFEGFCCNTTAIEQKTITGHSFFQYLAIFSFLLSGTFLAVPSRSTFQIK